jgi:LuxR family transcriptional regulator of csgAB operon
VISQASSSAAGAEPAPLKVRILSSQKMMGELVGYFLQKEAGIACTTQLCSNPDGEEVDWGADPPQVILLDYQSPEIADRLNDHFREFLEGLGGVPSIVFNFNRNMSLKKWISYGVRGLLFERESSQNIIKAVRAVNQGHLWFPRQAMSNYLRQIWDEDKAVDVGHYKLTTREREILLMVAEGKTNAEVAENLFISPYTVKVHLQNIYKKIGAPNRVKAAIWAHRHLGGDI